MPWMPVRRRSSCGSTMTGGAAEIECADNGHGIAPRDFALVAARSATSKLVNFEELRTVQSFGFRGEALASLREYVHRALVKVPNK